VFAALAILWIMQTILNLLTRDGAVYMAFSPSLSARQYGDLLELVDKSSGSQDELRETLRLWAKQQDLSVSFSEWESSRKMG
jgi:hypothetical protein